MQLAIGIKLFAIAALLVLIYIYLNNNITPLSKIMAESRAQSIAVNTITESVNKELLKSEVLYSDLVMLEKDNGGRITALRTNISKINQIKTNIMSSVQDALINLDTSEIGIPLGSLLNAEILAGRGPKIPIKLVPVGNINAEFENVFTSAGINQTRHQIILKINVNIWVVMPITRVSSSVTTSLTVAETIIVGIVPDNYAIIEDSTGGTPAEKYGNYVYGS